MTKKVSIKERLIEAYLTPQPKRWVRIIDALSAVFCFVSAIIAIYLLNTQVVPKLSSILNTVAWIYAVASLPLAALLYKESNLKKYERFIIVLFILASSMSLLIAIMQALIKQS